MRQGNNFWVILKLAAWKVTKEPLYQKTAEGILFYFLSKMQHKEGAFYSAEDADTDGVEGLFYTWTQTEIFAALGEEAGKLFCVFYNVRDYGEIEGRSVLHEHFTIDEFCITRSLDPIQFAKDLKKQRQILYEKRKKERTPPFCDTKIITSYNGLAIYAFAEASRVCVNKSEQYREAAEKAAEFIRFYMYKDDMLFRRWIEGETRFHAGLDDYAFLIRGLISLFEAKAGTKWLAWAIELTDTLQKLFKEEGGAFYQGDGMDPTILIRTE